MNILLGSNFQYLSTIHIYSIWIWPNSINYNEYCGYLHKGQISARELRSLKFIYNERKVDYKNFFKEKIMD